MKITVAAVALAFAANVSALTPRADSAANLPVVGDATQALGLGQVSELSELTNKLPVGAPHRRFAKRGKSASVSFPNLMLASCYRSRRVDLDCRPARVDCLQRAQGGFRPCRQDRGTLVS
jgi:hypothetical protein